MNIKVKHIDTEEGCELLAEFLDSQINRLVELEPDLRCSEVGRMSSIHPLYSSIIEDCISIRVLGENGRLNQAYILTRAFLKRLINYCFLQIAPNHEYENFMDYSKNKAGRRLSRSMEVYGEVKAKLEYRKGEYELPDDVREAVEKFTSERGREKTRWTKLGLPERAAVIEKETGKSSLFMHLLSVYGDASEAIHGTLYGALFHFGVYDPGSTPHDQKSLDKQRFSTLSMLYLVFGSAIDTLFFLLLGIGDQNVQEAASESSAGFKVVAVKTGLAQAK